MNPERREISEKANASASGSKIFPAGIAAQDSFKRQIILTFVVGFCLLAVAFTSYQVVSERSYLYRDNTDETTSLAESLAASSRSWVLANDVAGLQEVVHSFQSHPELRYALVISPSGKVLANTDATKVGQFLSDELSLSLIKTQPFKLIMIDDEFMSDVAVPIMLDHRHIGWARVAQGREGITRNLHKMMLNSVLFVLVALIFSLFAALLIAKRLGYRIGYLVRVAEEVQAGNYATRANISGDDEIALLSNSLNHMLDVLAREEVRLRESEALFRNMFAKHTAIMFIVEPHTGEILDANKAAEAFYGYPTSRLCTMNIDDLNMLSPDQVLQEREKALHSERNYFVFPHRLANGEIRTVEVHSSPITLESRQVLFSIIHDITEREHAEFVLRQSEEALKEAQRMAHVGSWYMDLATNEVVWSEVLYQMYGFDPALPPPLYTESMKLFTPESWEKLSTAIARATETGVPYELELELIPKDGGRKWMLARGELVRDASGVPVRVRGVVMDITERKLADNAIREKEERLALATINNGVGIWDWNLQTQQMIWDDSMFALYHIHREDFIGTEEAWRASLHPDDLARGDQEVADALSGKKPFETEFRVVWPNGEIRYIKAVAKVFRNDQGMPLRMLGINMDVTDRNKAEMELRESEDKFKYVFDHSPIGKTLTLPSGELQVNKSFCEMLGYSDKELGHSLWRDITHPDDIEMTQRAIDQMLSGEMESTRLVKRYLHKNGSVVWVDVVTSLRRDPKGLPLYFMTSVIDITERKHTEDQLHSYHEHLEELVKERTGKLEDANKELESFSYSVSHDLRTPLRAIDGFCHILMDDYTEKLDDEGKRLLNVVRDNTRKMGQLIDDILAFSRTGRVEINLAQIDMEKLAREVITELSSAIPKGKLQVEIEHIPVAMGDAAMMRQVFVNLLANAIKFSANREVVMIKVGSTIAENEIVYFVKDNGAGFDMQYADKLFGVFQRLHAVSEFEGTGIGLAIVKRIITRHGGRVWAEGKVNEGATIYFAIPIQVLVEKVL